jgi:hypothetical protein
LGQHLLSISFSQISLIGKQIIQIYIARPWPIHFFILGIANTSDRYQAGEGQTLAGLDVVMALDVSRSMLAEDVQPNRLSKAKNQSWDFVGQARKWSSGYGGLCRQGISTDASVSRL